MKTRIFTAIVMTALLILSIVGSAMCTPTELPDQAAQKAIDALQKEIDAKGYNWTAGITSVSGLTDDEKKKLCGVKPIKDVKEKKQHPNKLEPVGTYPETFDWRDNGGNWMTSVKDQGCGDCWAFSAIGIVESKIKIQANDPNLDIDLSEQHLVSDCCSAGDCSGGWPGQVLEYMYYTGVPSEACFPYKGGDCACIPCEIWTNNRWNIDSFSSTKYQIVYKDRILSNGPMSAVIKVYDDFLDYNGGVYQRTSNNFSGYHAIVIVGWNDTEESWIIKNSWGEGWGENGYGRFTADSFASGYSAYTVRNISHYVPIVEVSASPINGTCPLTVAFSATGTDYDGTMVSCEWDFGDGASSTSQNPTHIYNNPGTYTATIYVTDNDGHIGIANSVVTCGQKVSPVTASASSYIFGSSYAIDGDLDTCWLSGVDADDCWIMFDFGETIELPLMLQNGRLYAKMCMYRIIQLSRWITYHR
jgi:C1A family cysteine protease